MGDLHRYNGAKERAYPPNPTQKVPKEVLEQRKAKRNENHERTKDVLIRIAEKLRDMVTREAEEHGLDEKILFLGLGQAGIELQRKSAPSPINGFTKITAEKHNSGKPLLLLINK